MPSNAAINAEHPEKFTPSAGKITAFNLPGGNGVRVDTAQYAEGVVPPYYDSLIAKLICHGKDREEAMNKTQRALESVHCAGHPHLDSAAPEASSPTPSSAPVSSTPSSWSDSSSAKATSRMRRWRTTSRRCNRSASAARSTTDDPAPIRHRRCRSVGRALRGAGRLRTRTAGCRRRTDPISRQNRIPASRAECGRSAARSACRNPLPPDHE